MVQAAQSMGKHSVRARNGRRARHEKRSQTCLVSLILSLHQANVAKNWTGREGSIIRPLTRSVEPMGCLDSRDPAASWNHQSEKAQHLDDGLQLCHRLTLLCS